MPNVKTTTIKIIVKTHSRDGLVAFLPEAPAPNGSICCFFVGDGFGLEEVSLQYYRECLLADSISAEEAIMYYYHQLDDFVTVKLAKRLLHKDLVKAWNSYALSLKS